MQARTKAAYSAYTKMQRKGMCLQELDDLLGSARLPRARVTKKLPVGLHRQRQSMLCYRVLEVAHALPERMRQAYHTWTWPKPNGYQSLHSTVEIVPGLRSELQVRTDTMHRYAEHGKAAHRLQVQRRPRRRRLVRPGSIAR